MNQKPSQETEIDFINLSRTFWDGRFVIGKFLLLGMFIGFFEAILIPNEYTASSTRCHRSRIPNQNWLVYRGWLQWQGLI